ncbi:MAG TPA: RNA polymerase sigma factor [Acidimicrobiales bacterium]
MTDVAAVFRREYGRSVATLIRFLGDIELAEEAVQDAFVVALERWEVDGAPSNPGAWIVTTARNHAIDRVRRESSRAARQHAASHLERQRQPSGSDEVREGGPLRDDRLRLVFTCCHPALQVPAQVALTLRLLGGLSTEEIARAFLVSEATMAQRLVRAKRKIRDARIPYRVPSADLLPERLPGVLGVVYLVFNEGYAATAGDALVRDDLCEESVRLARLLAELLPDEPEALGLLALLLLTASRRAARTTADGSLVLLADQDRSRWDASAIAEGAGLVERALRMRRPGPYQLQAAIAAVHAHAATADETDWVEIVGLYDALLRLNPSPVVALNRAVAVAELDGPAAALPLLDRLPELDDYYLFHATRADLLRRLGRRDDARRSYERAIGLTANGTERAFLQTRVDALG